MNRILEPLLRTVAVSAAILITGAAQAEECMLGPVALPGLPGAPEWEDFNADGFWRPELHDPRWSGATLDFLTYVPGSGDPAWQEEVGIRAVANGSFVYLSFQAQSDDTGPNGYDYVYVGLSEGTSRGWAVRISADFSHTEIGVPAAPPPPDVVIADSPRPRQILPAGVSSWTSADGTTWSAPGAMPTWLKGAIWNRASGSPRWAVTLRIDLSASGLVVAPGNMRYFFGANVNKSTGDVLVGNVTPKTASDQNKVGDSIIPSQVSAWVPYYFPGTLCTEGVTLAPNDVGVWSGVPGSYAGGTLTNQICAGPGGTGTCATSTGVNTFRVTARKVENSAGIAEHALRARVRIANWGTQVPFWKFGLWKDVAPPPVIGTDIFKATVADLNANGWTWLTPVDAGDGTSAVTVDYTCSKQGTDSYCPKLEDETQSHQCMLVELGQPPPGAGLPAPFKIKNNAVYRNMTYENLSTSDVPATISLAGLKDALGAAEAKDRDVYLYVESQNLPAHANKALWLPAKDMQTAKRFADNPVFVPTVPGKLLPSQLDKNGRIIATAKVASLATNRATKAASKRILERNRLALELANRLALSQARFSNGLPIRSVLAMDKEQLLDAVWPTYRVRSYYDSGKTHTARGKTSRVLVPMVPFGFRFLHDGALYGFGQALSAMPGVVVQQLSPNWFKITVKSEGRIGIRTRVVAEESPLTPPVGTGGSGPVTPCPSCPKCPPVEHKPICNCRFVEANRGGLLQFGALLALGFIAFARRSQRKRRTPAA